MKKKLVMLLPILALCLVSCTEHKAKHAHVYRKGEVVHYNISGWSGLAYSDNQAVKIEGTSQGTIYAIKDECYFYDGETCPICGPVEHI